MRIHVAALIVAFATSTASADVSVTFTTTPKGGPYAPTNVVAVWIEDQAGAFVKTVGRYAAVRKVHLVAWNAKAGANDVDAVSGATRLNNAAPVTMTWNLRDKAGTEVPDGTYTLRMELADANSTTVAQNHEATFTFTKGVAPQMQTGLTNNGFTNVAIDFQPLAGTCNNGVVEAGETCEPAIAGSCPASCEPSLDACMQNNLVGNAAACSAECLVEPISACENDDGCCPEGCEATDSDCGGDDISGGCDVGNGDSLIGLVALAIVLLLRRRHA